MGRAKLSFPEPSTVQRVQVVGQYERLKEERDDKKREKGRRKSKKAPQLTTFQRIQFEAKRSKSRTWRYYRDRAIGRKRLREGRAIDGP